MRLLLIHQEAEYFAGAEVLLGYFLDEIRSTGCQVTVALVPESRTAEVVPSDVPTLALASNARFGLGKFFQQLGRARQAVRTQDFDLIHGWAARDWELAAATGWLTKRPVVGTLHDHPRAGFISVRRQKLMRWCANQGLARVVCISRAVQAECAAAGYAESKLVVIHNGLPGPTTDIRKRPSDGPVRLGFLGAFSERKGLPGLFHIADHLAKLTMVPWELHLGGAPQNAAGEALVNTLRCRYEKEPWYSQVRWRGWIRRPLEFMAQIDILICPSSEFEPFGLVLCEAGWLGLPVLASRAGGIPEIVDDGQTGWLFEVGDWQGAAARLVKGLENAQLRQVLGERGRERVLRSFTIEKMVAEYVRLYSTLRAV